MSRRSSAASCEEEHPLATEIIKRIKPRERALLRHAAARHRQGIAGRSFSDVGAAIAHSLCPRLGLSADDTATVAWLVKNHLVMSDTAQRRDISDPKTVRDFVAMVQSPEMLRLLLVLTVADIRAVGPGVWNGWKGQLLRELYYAAENMMTGGDQAPTRGARVAAAKDGAGQAHRRFHAASSASARCRRHYDNYWLAFDTDEQERHARLIAKADAEGQLSGAGGGNQRISAPSPISSLYTPDHPGLFSQIAGAIAVSGGSIVDAKAFTTSDGFALDVFSVQDAEGGAFGDAAARRRACARPSRRPCAARSGRARPDRQAPPEEPRQRLQDPAARCISTTKRPHIATVVEVECLDRPGFLYRCRDQALFEFRACRSPPP